MNQSLISLAILGLVLMFILAPFGGLAPLLLIFLITSGIWAVVSIFATAFSGQKSSHKPE